VAESGQVPAPTKAERLKIALWAILAKEPVCRAERSILCPDEVKRRRGCGFCHLGTMFFEFYGCHDTNFIGSRSPIPLHRFG
jgi:hypothetical protein